MLGSTRGDCEVFVAGGRCGVQTVLGGQRGPHAGGGRRTRRRESRWELVWAGGRAGGALRRKEGLELEAERRTTWDKISGTA